MKRISKIIIIAPAFIGLIVFFFILLKIRQKRMNYSVSPTVDISHSYLPKGKLINLQTNRDDYESLKSGKVLLVFLTRGCDACKKEIPNIAQAVPSLVSKVAVYGVYIEERSDVDQFIQENQITFPILLDKG